MRAGTTNKIRVKTGAAIAALGIVSRCIAASAIAAYLWVLWSDVFHSCHPCSGRDPNRRPLWLLLVLMFRAGAGLSFRIRAPQYSRIRPARLIPMVMLLTWWAAQAIVIAHDVRVDPTSHKFGWD